MSKSKSPNLNSSLKDSVENLEKKADDQEQYLHKIWLLIHGLKETKSEEIVLGVISNELNIKKSQISIGRSLKLGKQRFWSDVIEVSCYCKAYVMP